MSILNRIGTFYACTSLYFTAAIANHFNCSSSSENDSNCDLQPLDCISDQDCSLSCDGPWSCNGVTISCPNSNNANNPYQCNIICNGDYACRELTVNDGIHSIIHINVPDPNSQYALMESHVNTQLSYNLTIIAYGYKTYRATYIWCPYYNDMAKKNTCNIKYIGETVGFWDTHISSPYSFNGINLICDTNHGRQGCIDPALPPLMFCSNLSYPWQQWDDVCDIAYEDGIEWKCVEENSTCSVTSSTTQDPISTNMSSDGTDSTPDGAITTTSSGGNTNWITIIAITGCVVIIGICVYMYWKRQQANANDYRQLNAVEIGRAREDSASREMSWSRQESTIAK